MIQKEKMLTEQSYTVDQMLEHVGSFGWYQIRLLLVLSYLEGVSIAWQVLGMTFIAAEPNWRCVTNSTECTQPGTFGPGNSYYNERCNMNRSEWEFTTEFTSITTEVKQLAKLVTIFCGYLRKYFCCSLC